MMTTDNLDLDALVEALSRELHAIYQAEARRQYSADLDDVRHPDDYEMLEEHTKEYDRVLARFILQREDALIQRLREAEAFGHEAERVVSKRNQTIGTLEARIAQLERVREAAQTLLDTLGQQGESELRAALTAVEEKP